MYNIKISILKKNGVTQRTKSNTGSHLERIEHGEDWNERRVKDSEGQRPRYQQQQRLLRVRLRTEKKERKKIDG